MEYVRKMVAVPADSVNTVPEGIVGPLWKPSSYKTIPDAVQGAVGPNWTPPTKKRDPIKDRIKEKSNKQTKIMLKLAKINAYNEEGEILLPNGEYMIGTDISSLIQKALSAGKDFPGESEFIGLLFRANVEPNLLINVGLKSKLIKLYQNKQRQKIIEPMEIDNVNPLKRRFFDTQQEQIIEPKTSKTEKSLKRTRNNDEEDEYNASVKRYKPNWDIPLPDTDDDE